MYMDLYNLRMLQIGAPTALCLEHTFVLIAQGAPPKKKKQNTGSSLWDVCVCVSANFQTVYTSACSIIKPYS